MYPDFGEFDFLEEYSKKFNTVEIDQWFWSLNKSGASLPKPAVVDQYDKTTPDDFKFTIKMPNSITLTHPYKSKEPNPYFLSVELTNAFFDSIEQILPKTGMLMLQFEYLNKQKMASFGKFAEELSNYINKLQTDLPLGVEIRNPNYLGSDYFKLLKELGLSHVFLQGYYMPDITKIYGDFGNYISGKTVIRLHGYDRKEIEEETKGIWNAIVRPIDDELQRIIPMIMSIQEKNTDLYLNVNNHYEGSAPLTIEKIKQLLKSA